MKKIRYRVNKKRVAILLLGVAVILSIIIIFSRAENRFFVTDSIRRMTLTIDFTEIEINQNDLTEIETDTLGEQAQITLNNSLMLVNKDYPIPADTELSLVDYKNTGVIMDSCMTNSYESLSLAVKTLKDSTLYVMDSYRSSAEQMAVYAADSKVAAEPGTSEHELGLALDIYVQYFAGSGFIKSTAGQFVNRECWRYGFVIRYPMLKESVTGIGFEPWHIRYVGKPHAEIIYKKNLCLEDYIKSLTFDKFYSSGDYIITRQSGDILRIPIGLYDIVVSPDNMGNYILTGKLF